MFTVLVKDCKTKDGKKSFKSYKIVDNDNGGKLVDCVMCKTIDSKMKAELDTMYKAKIKGDISISHNYEYPKAFVRTIDEIEKVR